MRAITGGALGLAQFPDRGAAARTGFPSAPIHQKLILKISGTAVAADIVTQRAAAGSDG